MQGRDELLQTSREGNAQDRRTDMKESRNQDQSDLHQPVFSTIFGLRCSKIHERSKSVGPPSVSAPPSMSSILGDPISAGVSALHLSYRMILCLPVRRLLRLECQFFDDLILNGVPAPLSGNPIFHDPIPDVGYFMCNTG